MIAVLSRGYRYDGVLVGNVAKITMMFWTVLRKPQRTSVFQGVMHTK